MLFFKLYFIRVLDIDRPPLTDEWMFIFFTFPFTKHIIAWTNVFYIHNIGFKLDSSMIRTRQWMVLLLLVIFVHSFHYPSSINLMILYSTLGKLPAFTHPKIDWLVKFLYGLWIFLHAHFVSSIGWMNTP